MVLWSEKNLYTPLVLMCLFSTPYYCNQAIKKKILNRWDKVPFTKTDSKKKAGLVEHL